MVEDNSAMLVFSCSKPNTYGSSLIQVTQPLLDVGTSGPVIRVLPVSSRLEIDCLKLHPAQLVSEMPLPFRPAASDIGAQKLLALSLGHSSVPRLSSQ